MLSIMDKCNACKMSSKKVSDGSIKLYTCLYMKKNPILTKMIVMFVANNYMEIYIPHVEHEKVPAQYPSSNI
jgi:exoribonuclease R